MKPLQLRSRLFLHSETQHLFLQKYPHHEELQILAPAHTIMSQIQSPPQDSKSETKFTNVQAFSEKVEPPLQPAGTPSATQQRTETSAVPILPAPEPSPFQHSTEVTFFISL